MGINLLLTAPIIYLVVFIVAPLIGVVVGLILKRRYLWRICVTILLALNFLPYIFLQYISGIQFVAVVPGLTLGLVVFLAVILTITVSLILIWAPMQKKTRRIVGFSLVGLLIVLICFLIITHPYWIFYKGPPAL